MLETVVSAVVEALNESGVPAGPAWPREPARAESGGFVRVGVAGASDKSAGFARYLGVERDGETGEKEVYGLLCDMTLSLDVYAPRSEDNAALACLKLFDRAAAVVGGMGGLRVRELSRGAPGPDRDTGLFRLSGAAKCSGLLVAGEPGTEDTAFADFVLRGELRT